MQEIDVYIKVLEEHGFLFKDEYSRAGDDFNYLIYKYEMFQRIMVVRVYFNFKTGDVVNLFFNDNTHEGTRKSIENTLKISMRDLYINSILDE